MSPGSFLEETGLYEEPFAVFHATVNFADEEISIWAGRGGDDVIKRLFGCAVLFAMPEEGVNEALTSLKDIAVFHYETARGMLPPPPITHRHTGRIVGRSERPDLFISE